MICAKKKLEKLQTMQYEHKCSFSDSDLTSCISSLTTSDLHEIDKENKDCTKPTTTETDNLLSIHHRLEIAHYRQRTKKLQLLIMLFSICFTIVIGVGIALHYIYCNTNTSSNNGKANVSNYTCNDSCCLYCNSSLSFIIQSFDFWNDTKYFVDLSMKLNPEFILSAWEEDIMQSGNEENGTKVLQFIEQYFYLTPETNELQNCIPMDYNSNISVFEEMILDLEIISDPKLIEFAIDIYSLWPFLCKEILDQVYIHPLRHSLISLKHRQMIVAGGRFREMYYWDSLWIIKGLLISNMSQSAKYIVENLIELSKNYGHSLNGNRIYYQNRSQPPLLPMMINEIYEFDGNNQPWLMSNLESFLEILQTNYDWWMNTQSIEILDNYTLNFYNVSGAYARPEGFLTDMNLFSHFNASYSDITLEQIWSNIRSGAESGWDFTSRWCTEQQCEPYLTNLDTSNIIPVELNAYMYGYEVLMSKFYTLLNTTFGDEQSIVFSDACYHRLQALRNVMYDESHFQWRDFDIRANSMIEYKNVTVSISNYIPLWFMPLESEYPIDDILSQLLYSSGLIRIGGVATTMTYTGNAETQWDYPNSWPPLVYIIAEIADKYHNENGSVIAMQLLHNVTQTFVSAAYIGYYNSSVSEFGERAMFEKYNANLLGERGSGGEYLPQIGFGWTNGVTLSFLYKYGQFVQAPDL